MGGEGKMGSRQPSRINAKRIRVNPSRWEEEQNLRFGAAFRETCLRQGVSEEALRRFMASPDAETLETMSVLVEVATQPSASDALSSIRLTDGATGIIMVPRLTAWELVSSMKTHGDWNEVTFREGDTRGYEGAIKDELFQCAGVELEYLTWNPPHGVSVTQVSQYFEERGGFVGDPRALLAFAQQGKEDGFFYGSVPQMIHWTRSDRQRASRVLVPATYHGFGMKEFTLFEIDERESFPAHWVFVGFREIKT